MNNNLPCPLPINAPACSTASYGIYRKSNEQIGVACFGNTCIQYSMDLPEKNWPIAIYLGGVRKTIGIVGAGTEISIISDKILFSPGDIGALKTGNKYSIIIEFKNATYYYHYNFDQCDGSKKVSLKLKPIFVARFAEDSLWARIKKVFTK